MLLQKYKENMKRARNPIYFLVAYIKYHLFLTVRFLTRIVMKHSASSPTPTIRSIVSDRPCNEKQGADLVFVDPLYKLWFQRTFCWLHRNHIRTNFSVLFLHEKILGDRHVFLEKDFGDRQVFLEKDFGDRRIFTEKYLHNSLFFCNFAKVFTKIG